MRHRRRAGPGRPSPRSAATTTDGGERPLPGSHARDVPSGTLEESAAALYEAAILARDAEGGDDPRPLHAFYRAIGAATLLLPVPPGTEQETHAAVEAAVEDDEEVEVGVLLARGPDGPVSVAFGSHAALAAWSPLGSSSLALPARIALTNLAAAGLPVILDPAGPIPYRFEPDEIAALAEGRVPGTDDPLVPPTSRSAIRVRLPGPEARDTERRLAAELASWPGVREAYLVETDTGSGWRLLLGLVGGGGPMPPVPAEVEIRWLSEPLLGSVRAVSDPFVRGHR